MLCYRFSFEPSLFSVYYNVLCGLNLIEWQSFHYPSTHMTLFWRPYNVVFTYGRCMNVETTSCAYLVSPYFLFQNRFTRVLGFLPKVKFWLRLLFFILSVYFLSVKNRVIVLMVLWSKFWLHGIVFIMLVFFSGTYIEGLKKLESLISASESHILSFWCLISPVQVCYDHFMVWIWLCGMVFDLDVTWVHVILCKKICFNAYTFYFKDIPWLTVVIIEV